MSKLLIVLLLFFVLIGCMPQEPPQVVERVDNSTSQYFPPIGHQIGKQCSVFTLVYYQLSYEYSRKAKEIYIFSPRLAWEEQDLGAGVDLYRTVRFMIDEGTPEESVYPYKSYTKPTAEVWSNAALYKIETAECIKIKQDSIPSVIEQAKETLRDGHLLSFGTFYFSWRSKKIEDNPDTLLDDLEIGKSAITWVYKTAGQHSLTIVGYNDTLWVDINSNGVMEKQELGAFKVVNSYGTEMGDEGFHWIAYDSIYKRSTLEGAPVDDTYRSTSFATALYKIVLKEE